MEWIGQTLSKVLIEKRLGRGGTAEVYLGQHTTLNRPVAVKILHSHLADDEASLARFRAEAQAVAGLRHPHIVQVLDFDVAFGRPYIVMEFVTGLPLDEYLERVHALGRTLSPETTARLIVALSGALDYAHARGIIHRDIKPANVFLRREGGPLEPEAPLPLDTEPVLGDFGVAHFAANAAHTLSGTLSGTPAYISPEQARGDVVDARTDVYSLGVMLYEMLAGRPPFETGSQSPVSVILKHMTEPPPLVPHASPAVQAVLDRALAKDPGLRYARTGDLAMELLHAIFGQRAAAPAAADVGPASPLLAALLDTLDLLASQARAYERALPPSNAAAHTAVSMLGELARQAQNEAGDLAASLKPAPPAPHPFSPRELQVLSLAAQGLTNKEIAYRLRLSERTVQFHMNSVFNKTSTSSRTEAASLALKQGWIASER